MTAKKTPAKVSARTPGGVVSLTKIVKAMNRWRDQLNPTAGLTMRQARWMIDSYLRGDFADVQWLFGAPFAGIENSDADLLALIELRTGAVGEMDWQVKIRAQVKNEAGAVTRPVGFDKVLAAEQAAALDEAYDAIDNIGEAIEHLALAKFRGYAHLEKHTSGSGDVMHLECVDQWNVVRDGYKGDWKYNPDATMTSFRGLPDANLILPEDWIIREAKRPVNRIALTKFIRMGLSQKDWDAFIEIYGLPSGIVIMPPNVATDKEAEFEAAAKDVAEGGSGALPHGSDYKANDAPRGVNPFRDHLRYLTEQLVLAGTGGKLTMLTESGSGTLAGGAHSDTFRTIARNDAKQIGACFQRQLDAAVLERYFPARPRLAYFELCFADETDTGEFVKDVQTLGTGGYDVDPAQITEKTGYRVTRRVASAPSLPSKPGDPKVDANGKPLTNRAPGADDPALGRFMATALDAMMGAQEKDLQALRTAISEVLQKTDADLPASLEALRAQLYQLAPDLLAANAQSEALTEILTAALFDGLTTQP